MSLRQTWDLEAFFPGGSSSPELTGHLDAVEARIVEFRKQVLEAGAPQSLQEAIAWSSLLEAQQEIAIRLREAGAFIGCLDAQNMKDQKAKLLMGRLQQTFAAFSSVLNQLDAQMLATPEDVWSALLQTEQWLPVAVPLDERRRRAREKLSAEQESLITDLSVDGYHGWGHLYNLIVGRIQIPHEVDGKSVQLSAGQAFNKLSSPDRAERQQVFTKWEEAWQNEAELIGAGLNRLGGYRMAMYKHRGWDSILKEPLQNNRMTQETLDVMWDVVDRNKGPVVEYLQRKAKLLGLEQLAWYDVDAPLGASSQQVTYDWAADFIVEQFRKFDPKMADFSAKAFRDNWIEAEDRPGKRPGGFCTSFPISRQSRIFLTFGGTMGNVSTLAHELGHAWHQHVMNELPYMAQGYAMNVAETASTFAEMLVADAALKRADSRKERLALMADKVERAVAFMMNIHCRFIFETEFYAERKKGLLNPDRLSELMESAQKRAYKGALSQYHPTFWASKLHFYSTGQPFYNFPYTFGFLFSSGVYARALAEGPSFAGKYVDLLRDTGRMQVEDLAARHLGVDLTKPEFWQSAVDLSLADIREFLSETA